MNKPFTDWRTRHGPEPEHVPGHTPSFTLERHIDAARKRMGEEKWQQLQAEWNQAIDELRAKEVGRG